MTSNYSKVWQTMNDLEMVTSKVCSAREILDCAAEALENHRYAKVEALIYAADEFLQYYLEEFDSKFKDAWQETVVNSKNQKERTHYTEEEMDAMCSHAEQQEMDKVIKWRLPVDLLLSGDYFIRFPDDLLEQTGWKEGDELNWVNNGDGSFTVTKS